MPYAWMTTDGNKRAHEIDEADRRDLKTTMFGVHGPCGAPEDLFSRLRAGEGKRFKMMDDDQEVAVYGRAIFEPTEHEWFDEFEPLDDYGMPGLGMTTLWYWEKGADGKFGWQVM